jgi:hypothetical protein
MKPNPKTSPSADYCQPSKPRSIFYQHTVLSFSARTLVSLLAILARNFRIRSFIRKTHKAKFSRSAILFEPCAQLFWLVAVRAWLTTVAHLAIAHNIQSLRPCAIRTIRCIVHRIDKQLAKLKLELSTQISRNLDSFLDRAWCTKAYVSVHLPSALGRMRFSDVDVHKLCFRVELCVERCHLDCTHAPRSS